MSFIKARPERFVPRMAECLTASLAVLALAGWILHMPTLTSIMPGLASMKPNTAIGFLLLAGALYSAEQKRWPRCQRWLALAAGVIGSLTLFEYLAGKNFGLDEAFFRDPVRSLHPGRMASITAVNFILLASALLVPPFKRSDYLKELLALLLALASTLAIVGYVYGVPALYGELTSRSTAMALNTGVSFLVMAIGFLFIEREEGFVRVFRGPSIASMAARYMVPPAVLVPVILGGLFIRSRWNLGHPNLVMALSVVTDIVLLVVLIWLFAAMIQRVETERALIQQQAETDKLTGIYNRRHFESSLEQEIERARRYGAPLALLMIDVDNFKQLNDRRGHLVGDRLLCELTRECQSCLRASDVFCRYGGDEFAIIAPETSGEAAMALAGRIRKKVEGIGTDYFPEFVAISVGVAVWQDSFLRQNDLIAAADSALYEAKEAGRNRECLYTPNRPLTIHA